MIENNNNNDKRRISELTDLASAQADHHHINVVCLFPSNGPNLKSLVYLTKNMDDVSPECGNQCGSAEIRFD